MRRWKRKLMISGVVLIVLGAGVFGCQTREIRVTGNEYCSTTEIQRWIEEDPLSYNSLYTWWKYNYTDWWEFPSVEAAKVTLNTPWEITMRVYEKPMVGYIDIDGKYVYFDKDGMVGAVMSDLKEGVPLIEGVAVDKSKIFVHKKLPVHEKVKFSNIFKASQALDEQHLVVDRIQISESGEITFLMGNITIMLGDGDYSDKVAQIPPIMEKLKENYPDQAGVLHLEKFGKDHTSIPFTPE